MADVQAGSRYIIVNVKGGTVLDLSGNDQKFVTGWNNHGGNNQIWEVSEGEGLWYFKNAEDGKFLNLDDHEYIHDGLKVIASENPFGWHIWPDEDDPSVLRLCLPGTNFNIDLSDNGNPENGTPVELWGRWNGRNQCWRFEAV